MRSGCKSAALLLGFTQEKLLIVLVQMAWFFYRAMVA